MEETKYRAWLVNEKRMVTPSALIWNKGYGGALQIHVQNPNYDPLNMLKNDDIEYDKLPFFSYTNHTLKAHLERTPHEFILMKYIGVKDSIRTDEYPEGREIYTDYIIRLSCHSHSDNLGTAKGEWITIVKYDDKALRYYLETVEIGFSGKPLKWYFNSTDFNGYQYRKEVIGNIHQHPELLRQQ